MANKKQRIKQLKTRVKQLERKNQALKSEKNNLISSCLLRKDKWTELDYQAFIKDDEELKEKVEKMTGVELLQRVKEVDGFKMFRETG